ncbi:MAG TPA: hypothetical protein VJQ57_15875 [Acidimicrobiia bacterium]|nr:hypothetical protein [Acidimicrobiia bacterium]
MVREIITEWTGPGSSPKLSIMYFDETPTIASQRAALGTFWNAVDANVSNLFAWQVRSEGRELDDATGALTGFWNENTAQAGAGGSPTAPVADATQALIQWLTSSIIGGRRLRGRTFVPGLPQTAISTGSLASGIRTAIDTAADALVSSGAGLQVWHRPQNGAGGSAVAVSAASVWSEFAVQRGRRG